VGRSPLTPLDENPEKINEVALPSGSLISAQQDYLTLQSDLRQDFPNFSTASGSGMSAPSSGNTNSRGAVNVTA
jgi:hypothetical protein